jgi:hypothetical protein
MAPVLAAESAEGETESETAEEDDSERKNHGNAKDEARALLDEMAASRRTEEESLSETSDADGTLQDNAAEEENKVSRNGRQGAQAAPDSSIDGDS